MTARILIIEDNPENLELMRYLLNAFGYEAFTATSGESGLALAHARLPDLILCDVQLPGMDGLQVAQAAKRDESLRAIPLVAVTALAMVGDRDRILAAGFDGYIAKPIAPQALASQVADCLPAHARPDPARIVNLAGADTAAPYQAPPADSAHSRGTVLIVDDRRENIELMQAMLGRSGYRVLTAGDVAAALQVLRGQAPDLILSDVNMPLDDGFRLLAEVRSDPRLRTVRFAFLSASEWRPEAQQRALQLGADRFFVRPTDVTRLLSEIEACLSDPPATRHGDDSGS